MKERKSPAWSARTWLGNWKLTTFCALVFTGGALLAPVPGTAADRYETAALAPGVSIGRSADLPTILGAADAAHYRAIFKLQDDGQWRAADGEIEERSDPLLL